MKKKLLTLLLSIAVILTSTVTVFAESEGDTFTFDGINYKITSIGDTNNVEVSSNSSYSGNTVTIPETVTSTGGTTYTVTSITNGAFSDNSIIETVILPSSITEIGDIAFMGSSKIQTIVCKADNPPTLGDNVFKNCSSIKIVQVPASSVESYKTSNGRKDTEFKNKINKINTISDVLATAANTFPTTAFAGWVNRDNNSVIYATQDGKLQYKPIGGDPKDLFCYCSHPIKVDKQIVLYRY